MLALALGGKSVEEWKASITRKEFESWVQFYRLYPFDDRHRFHRPAALIASRGDREGLKVCLEWLQPDPVSGDYSEAEMNTFRAFGITPPGRE